MVKMKKDNKRSLILASIYVGFSTIMLYTLYPSDPFSFEFMRDNLVYLIMILIAIPGQLLSWGLRYGGFDSWYTELFYVSISQLFNLLMYWWLILYLKRK